MNKTALILALGTIALASCAPQETISSSSESVPGPSTSTVQKENLAETFANGFNATSTLETRVSGGPVSRLDFESSVKEGEADFLMEAYENNVYQNTRRIHLKKGLTGGVIGSVLSPLNEVIAGEEITNIEYDNFFKAPFGDLKMELREDGTYPVTDADDLKAVNLVAGTASGLSVGIFLYSPLSSVLLDANDIISENAAFKIENGELSLTGQFTFRAPESQEARYENVMPVYDVEIKFSKQGEDGFKNIVPLPETETSKAMDKILEKLRAKNYTLTVEPGNDGPKETYYVNGDDCYLEFEDPAILYDKGYYKLPEGHNVVTIDNEGIVRLETSSVTPYADLFPSYEVAGEIVVGELERAHVDHSALIDMVVDLLFVMPNNYLGPNYPIFFDLSVPGKLVVTSELTTWTYTGFETTSLPLDIRNIHVEKGWDTVIDPETNNPISETLSGILGETELPYFDIGDYPYESNDITGSFGYTTKCAFNAPNVPESEIPALLNNYRSALEQAGFAELTEDQYTEFGDALELTTFDRIDDYIYHLKDNLYIEFYSEFLSFGGSGLTWRIFEY